MPKTSKETSDEVSTKAARLAAMGDHGVFWFVPYGWSHLFKTTKRVRRDPERVTDDVLSVAGSALSQDQTPGKRKAKKRAKAKRKGKQ